MYRVITENEPLEVWAVGFESLDKAQEKIDSGYFHRYMFEKDRAKKLVAEEYKR